MEMNGMASLALLNLHAQALEELRQRGLIRSSNNPVGDYAEYLFCKAFGWEQAGNSEKDADAVGRDGLRYQVKGRRLTRHNSSRQLGAIRRLPEKNFDILAGVLFREDFSILRAALVPYAVVVERTTYVAATNSWRLLLTDDIWSCDGVVNVTAEMVTASA